MDDMSDQLPLASTARVDTSEIDDTYDPSDGGAFDWGLFALLIVVVTGVAISNLWLRWRAEDKAFLPELRRRLGLGSDDSRSEE
jgi:hypothetical protein